MKTLQRFALALLLPLAGCVGIPDKVAPVAGFKLERYLGTWYEIARLDHSFERGLSHVSAKYSLRDGGGVTVLNRGYSAEKHEWKDAKGKAFFVERPDLAYLKVSFFGPFYGAYIVFDLADDYSYSMISGPDKSYLWILSRTPTLAADVKARLVAKAQALGFDTARLVEVEQGGRTAP